MAAKDGAFNIYTHPSTSQTNDERRPQTQQIPTTLQSTKSATIHNIIELTNLLCFSTHFSQLIHSMDFR